MKRLLLLVSLYDSIEFGFFIHIYESTALDHGFCRIRLTHQIQRIYNHLV